jgi:succinate dehydrogenase/fumarate reductase cytochrome b subunit
MDETIQPTLDRTAALSPTRKLVALAPLAAALAYPFLLKGFHAGIRQPTNVIAWGSAAFCLLGAFAMPMFALVCARELSRSERTAPFDVRARRLAYLAMAAPPLFVLTGVARGLLGRPLSDETVWIGFWLIAAAVGFYGSDSVRSTSPRSVARWRVLHGVSAALIACFVLFHLINHLFGWRGPQVHETVMHLGRSVYRSPFVEPVLLASLLFQIISGVRVAWHWSAQPSNWYRVFQIGSGVFLAAFVVTHLNSALVSARWVRGTETDWAWATGAPEGLIYDSWNIRLLPHYAFGVFFVLSHLASGLRQILIAHGCDVATANRMWVAGLIAAASGTAVIIGALIGA